jgi:DNA-binding NarL/FixJ family response regulator
MIRIFIIDDHPSIIEGLEFVLSDYDENMELVGSANGMNEVCKLPDDCAVDVFILDLFLGETDPVENLLLLRNKFPTAAVVIYSAEDSTYWTFKMLKAGANAYHSKCVNFEVLFETIKNIANGSLVLSDEQKDMFYHHDRFNISFLLDENDLRLCNFLAHGYSLKEIAKTEKKSISLIGKRVGKIRKQFGARSISDLIRILIRMKLIAS